MSDQKPGKDPSLVSSIARQLGSGVVVIGSDGRNAFVNKALCRMVGWSENELLGNESHHAYWPEDDRTHERTDLALILAGKFPTQGAPTILQRRNGDRFPALLLVELLQCPDLWRGDGAGWLVNIVDLSAQATSQVESNGCPRLALDELITELTRYRAAAAAADEIKSNFLSKVNHELRTPLNSIAGLTYLLRRSSLTPLQFDRVEKIDRAGHQLLKLVTEILEFARVRSETQAPPEKRVDAPGIVADVAGAIAKRARDKGLFVVVDTAELQHDLLGNPVSVRQALLNYAENAVKFTHSGGITLRAATDGDAGASTLVRFEVRDTGDGIRPEVLPRLFTAFEQGDNSITRRDGGLGLGLAMTRSLARSMGGDAGVTSRVGSGSTFWFTARCAKDKPSQPAMGSAKQTAPPLTREAPGTGNRALPVPQFRS